jgi:antibiotic biosynthesis monooxygenase (ABM) superfamily enzyme
LLKFLRNGLVKNEFFIELQRTTAMTYRTYSGPRGSQAIAPLEKDRLLYKEFDTLDGALAWARHVNEGGRVALLIEGDDGTHLGKQEIAGALHHREAPPR